MHSPVFVQFNENYSVFLEQVNTSSQYNASPSENTYIAFDEYHTDLMKFTLLLEKESMRYSHRVEQLCDAGVVQCSLAESSQNKRPQIIQNPPCCKGNLDPFGWRVQGAGLGAAFLRNKDQQIIAGHIFLTNHYVQTVPSLNDLIPCYVHTECTFSIQAYDIYGQISSIGGADFRMRLVGDTMIPGNVDDMHNGTYVASYTPIEPGSYLIEVFLGVLQGEGAEVGHPITNPYIVDAVITVLNICLLYYQMKTIKN